MSHARAADAVYRRRAGPSSRAANARLGGWAWRPRRRRPMAMTGERGPCVSLGTGPRGTGDSGVRARVGPPPNPNRRPRHERA
eukprot:1780261-Lingulodinium_polyedra.AAC.1